MELTLNGSYIEKEKIKKLAKIAEESGKTLAQLNTGLFDLAIRDPQLIKGWLPIADISKEGLVLTWSPGMSTGDKSLCVEGDGLQKRYTHFHHIPLPPHE
jgi:hypothetical protein